MHAAVHTEPSDRYKRGRYYNSSVVGPFFEVLRLSISVEVVNSKIGQSVVLPGISNKSQQSAFLEFAHATRHSVGGLIDLAAQLAEVKPNILRRDNDPLAPWLAKSDEELKDGVVNLVHTRNPAAHGLVSYRPFLRYIIPFSLYSFARYTVEYSQNIKAGRREAWDSLPGSYSDSVKRVRAALDRRPGGSTDDRPMSTDDTNRDKSRHETHAQTRSLPDRWHEAEIESDAELVHESGARLIIRRAAPTKQPSPRGSGQRTFKLDFQPPGRNRLIPVTAPGNKLGLRDAAREFASRNPDAEPTAQDMVEWIDEVEV